MLELRIPAEKDFSIGQEENAENDDSFDDGDNSGGGRDCPLPIKCHCKATLGITASGQLTHLQIYVFFRGVGF